MRLNLGCGRKYLDGYVNCDAVASVRTDKVFDLNKPPYPFEPNSADAILMDNVLEHLDDVVSVMEELHRVLKPGGVATIIVPYGKSDWAFQDPTHRHFFTERSMDYFTRDHGYNFYSNAEFKLLAARLITNNHTPRLRLRNLLPFKSVLRYFLYNVYDVVHFELQKPT